MSLHKSSIRFSVPLVIPGIGDDDDAISITAVSGRTPQIYSQIKSQPLAVVPHRKPQTAVKIAMSRPAFRLPNGWTIVPCDNIQTFFNVGMEFARQLFTQVSVDRHDVLEDPEWINVSERESGTLVSVDDCLWEDLGANRTVVI
jgi:hypothetical protein